MVEKMKKQILRKEISRDILGDVETIKNEYIERDVLSDEELDDLQDHWEDPDEAFDVGLIGGFDSEIFCIEIDKLLVGLRDFIDDPVNKDEMRCDVFKIIEKKLGMLEGFDLWV